MAIYRVEAREINQYWGPEQGTEARRLEVDSLAAQAQGGFNHNTDHFLSNLQKKGFIKPGMSVLVLACGTGQELPVLAGYFETVEGTDKNEDNKEDAEALIKHFNLQGRVRFEVADATNLLSYPDHSFDVVYSQVFDQHVTDEQRRQVFAERKRVVKPGGLIIVQDLDTGRDGPDESWGIEPAHPAFERLWDVMMRSYELRKAEPRMGRKLEDWFIQSGLTNIIAKDSYVVKSTRSHPMHPAHIGIFGRQIGIITKQKDLQGLEVDLNEFNNDMEALKGHLFSSDDVIGTTPRMYFVAARV